MTEQAQEPKSPAILEGIRVVDLTTGSFNYAGRLLAGLGAEVIKIESTEGDPLRHWGPFRDDKKDIETGGRHLHLDAGKRSISIDIDSLEGQNLATNIIGNCDVVLESFEPGYLETVGLSFESLASSHTNLIMVSMSHFGQSGPYKDYNGSEIVDVAIGGYLRLTGEPDREPVKPYDDLVIQHTALHAATAAVVGIMHRDNTGEGDWFDVAAIDAALFLIGGPTQSYFFNGRVAQRNGNRLLFTEPQYLYPSTIRPCLDGYVHAHGNNRNQDLLAVLMPDIGLEPLFDTPMGNADKIDELMDLWLSTRDKFEVVRLAQELRLPFTEVLTPEEILQDPHLEERGFLVNLKHPLEPNLLQPGHAALMSETPWINQRAPLIGEHTDEILQTLLGIDEDERAELRDKGVIE